MAGEGRGAEVEIFGERYTLRSSDAPEYLRRVAEYVDAKFREVSRQSPALVPSRVAVLVSVTLADELFKQGEDARRRAQDALERIDEIAALLRQEDDAE